ncbi:MAG: tetratricopeptide repeat protein [Chloroflexota bacterium]
MANGHLSSQNPGRFQDYVLTNVQYWRDFVADDATTLADLDQGRQRIVTAIQYALEHEPAWADVAPLISDFTPHMERRGHWDVWHHILTRAIAVAQTHGDQQHEVEFSALLARLYSRQNQPKDSVRQYRRTIVLARQIRDRYNEARTFTNLGYLFVELEYWWRAEVLCCVALEIFEELDNLHGQAHTHNHLGSLYLYQYHWVQAQYHLERACAFWKRIEDHHGLMYGFLNLSLLNIEAERPEQALYYTEQALIQANVSGETSEIGSIYLNMSYAHYLNNNLEEAKSYAYQSEKVYRQYANTRYLILTWISLGEIFLEQKKFEKAKNYLESALYHCQEHRYNYGEIRAIIALIKSSRLNTNQDYTNSWMITAQTKIAQLGRVEQRNYFQSLLERYS